jgi:hypothetical protein
MHHPPPIPSRLVAIAVFIPVFVFVFVLVAPRAPHALLHAPLRCSLLARLLLCGRTRALLALLRLLLIRLLKRRTSRTLLGGGTLLGPGTFGAGRLLGARDGRTACENGGRRHEQDDTPIHFDLLSGRAGV